MVKKIYDSVAIAEVYTGESIIPEDCTELCAQANQLRRGILQALRNFEDKHRVAEPYLYIKTPEIDVDSAQPSAREQELIKKYMVRSSPQIRDFSIAVRIYNSECLSEHNEQQNETDVREDKLRGLSRQYIPTLIYDFD